MPSAEHEALVEALLQDNPIQGETLEEQRDEYRDTLLQMPIDDDVSIEETRIAGCAADWVSTPDALPDRQVLYLHGGGYVIGDNVGYREFASRLARACRARVCVLNYRLAPEHPFPAAVDDAVAAFREIAADNKKTALVGDSAGGGLALVTMMRLRDEGVPLPVGAMLFSPWTDLALTGASMDDASIVDPLVARDGLQQMAELYVGNDVKNPLASPLYGELTGLAPILLQVGTREVLFDDSRRLAEIAREANVDIEYHEEPGLIHVWPVLAPGAPETITALQRCGDFLACCCD